VSTSAPDRRLIPALHTGNWQLETRASGAGILTSAICYLTSELVRLTGIVKDAILHVSSS
jgi:hypothetical protein